MIGTDAYNTIAAILKDAHQFYNVSSISIKKRAFFETDSGIFYDISGYRVPRSHCVVNEGARVRLDQPRFKMEETANEIKISFHDKYLELLPSPLLGGVADGEDEEAMEEDEFIKEILVRNTEHIDRDPNCYEPEESDGPGDDEPEVRH